MSLVIQLGNTAVLILPGHDNFQQCGSSLSAGFVTAMLLSRLRDLGFQVLYTRDNAQKRQQQHQIAAFVSNRPTAIAINDLTHDRLVVGTEESS